MVCVLFRTDADQAMGMGHVMRCRAVAEAVLERGGRALFVSHQPPAGLAETLSAAGVEMHRLAARPGSADDLRETLAVAAAQGATALVADGYHFTSDYLAGLDAALPLAVLDDMAMLDPLPGAVVVNASPGADRLPYGRIAPAARKLLGAAYALIRTDIRRWIGREAVPPSARRRVVVTFGGSDPLALTAPVARRLRAALPDDVGLDVVIGPATRDAAALAAELAPERAGDTVQVAPPSLAPLFAAAGLVVTAGGGTVGELVALGVPAVVAVVVDNQEGAAATCPYPCIDARQPGAVDVLLEQVLRLWNDPPGRDAQAAGLRGLVDGQGALRVADVLLTLEVRP